MESCAYFISDAHLGVNPPGALPDREKMLVDFLASIKGKASHLVVVGDLFEFWYEYSDYVNKNHMELFFMLRRFRAPIARKRAQYSKSPEVAQTEVQENLNFAVCHEP